MQTVDVNYDDALTAAVDATTGRLRALDEANRLQNLRHDMYRQMERGGMSHRAISMAMEAAMRRQGFTDEQIAAAGISSHSITQGIGRLPKSLLFPTS